ncbi:lactate/malate family dehydrogenase [Microbacterium sp. A93]|uniref:lactate/malate family dehydrogenase n=1 Tax=Microbacterium sp. A93 TaxID=3450716 RepID=UPI003F43327A
MEARETVGGWPRRIAVIGAAGTVGSSVAAQIAMAGIGSELYLMDVRENIVTSHAIDITDAQAVTYVPGPRAITGPPADGPVDVVVVAASKPEVPDGDRRHFLTANIELLGQLRPQIESLAGSEGLVLLLSNPVDILAGWLARNSSLPEHRILGYSLNDSARFRSAVARVLRVGTERVDGKVMGEHGNGQVPLFSSVRLDGEPVSLSAPQRHQIVDDVHGWFRRWSSLDPGRSSGWATGVGVRHLLQELQAGRPVVTTAGTGRLVGYPRTFMALEVRRGEGRIEVLPPDAEAQEVRDLLAAARRIHDEVEALGTSGPGGIPSPK